MITKTWPKVGFTRYSDRALTSTEEKTSKQLVNDIYSNNENNKIWILSRKRAKSYKVILVPTKATYYHNTSTPKIKKI